MPPRRPKLLWSVLSWDGTGKAERFIDSAEVAGWPWPAMAGDSWTGFQMDLHHKGKSIPVRVKSICWTVFTNDSTIHATVYVQVLTDLPGQEPRKR